MMWIKERITDDCNFQSYRAEHFIAAFGRPPQR
jgi:hypothetical protein